MPTLRESQDNFLARVMVKYGGHSWFNIGLLPFRHSAEKDDGDLRRSHQVQEFMGCI